MKNGRDIKGRNLKKTLTEWELRKFYLQSSEDTHPLATVNYIYIKKKLSPATYGFINIHWKPIFVGSILLSGPLKSNVHWSTISHNTLYWLDQWLKIYLSFKLNCFSLNLWKLMPKVNETTVWNKCTKLRAEIYETNKNDWTKRLILIFHKLPNVLI